MNDLNMGRGGFSIIQDIKFCKNVKNKNLSLGIDVQAIREVK